MGERILLCTQTVRIAVNSVIAQAVPTFDKRKTGLCGDLAQRSSAALMQQGTWRTQLVHGQAAIEPCHDLRTGVLPGNNLAVGNRGCMQLPIIAML